MEYSKEEKARISEAWKKIHKIFSMDEFPDYSVEKRHLQKLYGFECLSNGEVHGRNAGYPAPPVQIPACTTNALGSCFK